MEDKIKTKKEIAEVLSCGDTQEFANLWQCANNEEHYGKYVVDEFAYRETWKDGTTHLYGGVISLNDGKISEELTDWFRNHEDLLNTDGQLIYVKTDDYTNKEQVFFFYHNGTNGIENNALNSMKKAVDYLEKLQKCTRWATLLGALCDTSDDVYSWYFTFEL